MLNFMEVINHDTNQIKVVDELTNELFNQGYRFLQYIPNSMVDIYEIDAQKEEDTLLRLRDGSIPRELAIAEGTHPYTDIKDLSSAGESYFWTPMEIY